MSYCSTLTMKCFYPVGNFMFQLYKNIQTDFVGQIFLELFQFKTLTVTFLGYPVFFVAMVQKASKEMTFYC